MNFSKFRKLDYILFYLIISVLFIVQLSELLLTPVVGILIGATIPALTLGTIVVELKKFVNRFFKALVIFSYFFQIFL